jgi:uncharacterized phage protein gp47/JayE
LEVEDDMTFGMDSTGFTKKKLADIKLSLEEQVQAVFGIVNVDPESVFGQIIGIWSEASSELWDLAEDVYLSQYPVSAEGVPLDNVVDLTGITRLGASSSFVKAILEGDESTEVPAETQFKQSSTNKLLENDAPVTITKSDVLQIVITVKTVQDSTAYSVTIAGTLNQIVSDSDATEEEIIVALKTEIDTNMLDYTTEITVDNKELTVYITDKTTSFAADKTSNLDMEIWTPVIVYTVDKGSISIPVNSVDSIETPVSGLNQVDNLLNGELGRAVETDDELRLRRKQSLRVAGAATVPAIEASLAQDVDGVVSVIVVENRTDVTDGAGRPPHSFESIVSGGTDQDIADKIWEIKPAGIQTYGTSSAQIVDSQGTFQTMYFSRPVNKYVHLNIKITLYDEEQFPADGFNAIKQAIKDYGDTLLPGDDLLVQRFYTPIFTVQGIKSVDLLEFAITENPGDSTTPVATGTVSALASKKLIDTPSGDFVVDGVVSAMIAKNTTDTLLTSVNNVDSATQLDIIADIFDDIGDAYSVGGFGQVDIPLASDEVALFDVARIAVSET